MFILTKLPAILAVAASALALPADMPMYLFASVKSAPKAWAMDGPAAQDEIIELRFNLAKQNVAQFQELALNVRRLSLSNLGKRPPDVSPVLRALAAGRVMRCLRCYGIER